MNDRKSLKYKSFCHLIGERSYELSNHLNNVLSVISDKVIPHPSGGSVAYYKADILQSQDYSPFGVTLKGRNLKKTGLSDKFRFGYQGSEGDDELKGEGNSYTTFYRQLDPRLSRWFSIDPKNRETPWQSPYNSMDNGPVRYNDILGDKIIIRNTWKDDDGNWQEKNIIYKRGKLFTEDGKKYTPEANGYIEKVAKDLDQLKKDSKRAASLIADLDKSKNTHMITNHIYEQPELDGSGNRNGLLNDGTGKSTVTKYEAWGKIDVNGRSRSPRVGLIHELTHAWDFNMGYMAKLRVTFTDGVDNAEVHAIQVENTVRAKTGDPKRTTYGGLEITSVEL